MNMPSIFDQRTRWGIWFRRSNSNKWELLGTAGNREAASAWANRFWASGAFMVRPPTMKAEAASLQAVATGSSRIVASSAT